ncbi:transporter protein [Trypanosoma rangeli]|uniref:Transporter protein n=1 Tax=Trypanosoma rangeli TaxID=5698 RepID=A0A3R7R683_TRYRA|nr:transporter protein [Trypanosoma rangeli]RNE96694.1 transporter protein [Trypanosoma rangeli]|eukprot:RNE96694.1 transporter protein [Trypanosoma rangeli]
MPRAQTQRESSSMLVTARDLTEKGGFATTTLEVSINTQDPLDVDLSISIPLLRRNLLLFTVLKTIGSFDSGAFSAALGAENGIAEEWGLGTVRQGTLTSSVFLGNILGCPLSGHLFSHHNAKQVLVGSLILHTVFTFLFATLTNYEFALFCRFFIGITLSTVIVYVPVWVDIFAPRDRQSVWMASHNAGVPLGIMLGYTCGAFLPSYTNVNWEWAFYIKCILTIPAVAYLMRVDSRSIARPSRNRSESAPNVAAFAAADMSAAERVLNFLHSNMRLMWSSCIPLFCNTEYMCSTLAMCSLYFVVTGLQNFVTQYLREEPFNASMKTIMLGFGGAVVTAPVIGVIVGGILLDRIGGYQRNLRRVTTFVCVWGAAAAFFSVICIFVTDTMTFLFVISIVLFCGGAIVPPGSGTVVTSVPELLRPAAAAFSQMMYNLLGNFSGPMVCGYVAQWTGQLKYGIYTVLSCSAVGLIPMLVLLRKVLSTPEAPTPLLALARSRQRYPQTTAVKDARSLSAEVSYMDMMRHESSRMEQSDDDALLLDEEAVKQRTSSVNVTPNVNAFVTTSVAVAQTQAFSQPKKNMRQATKHAEAPVLVVHNGVGASKDKEQEKQREPSLSSVGFVTGRTPEVIHINGEAEEQEWVHRQRSCGGIAATNGSVESTLHRSEAMEGGMDGGDEFDLMMEADAAQMMSFPNRHSFGLDILRSFLSSASHRHSSSRSSSSNPSMAVTEELKEVNVGSLIDERCSSGGSSAISPSHTPAALAKGSPR